MFTYVLMIIVVLAVAGIIFVCDTLNAWIKLKRNQLLWDEYSKNMTRDEKMDCFIDWLERNKAEHGDDSYYIPRM